MGQEVVGPAVFVQAAHQVGDRRFDVTALNNGGVEEQPPCTGRHRRGYRRRHALEHLDLDPVAGSTNRGLGDRPRHLEEVVAGDSHADGPVVTPVQDHVEHALVVGVRLVLGKKGRRGPTVQLRVDVLHRQVRPFYQTHLHPGPGAIPAGPGPGAQFLEGGQRVG